MSLYHSEYRRPGGSKVELPTKNVGPVENKGVPKKKSFGIRLKSLLPKITCRQHCVGAPHAQHIFRQTLQPGLSSGVAGVLPGKLVLLSGSKARPHSPRSFHLSLRSERSAVWILDPLCIR
jgi:hypothetical protein